jgi:hypothetical protein
MSTDSFKIFLREMENRIMALFSEDHADARLAHISESAFIREISGKLLGPQIEFTLFWHDST